MSLERPFQPNMYLVAHPVGNVACIPTKSLDLSAEHAASHHPATFEEQQSYYLQAIEEKNRLVTFLRQKNYEMLNNNANVKVIDGTASFLSSHEIQVILSETQTALLIQAEHIIISTGTVPFLPPIAGLAQSKRVYTSTTLMECTQLPRHLIIIGSGYVGLEFASIYRAFGSQVTVLEQHAVFLPGQDRDIADAVQQTMVAQGICFHFNATVNSIEDGADHTSLTFVDSHGQCQIVTGDTILVAVGRVPETSQLELERANVVVNKRGFVEVDEYLRTNIPDIWAIGDVNGGPQFTYISLDDYRIVRDQLYGNRQRSTLSRQHIPYSVFLSPVLSRVGLSEEEALQHGYEIKVGKLAAAASTRAQMMGKTVGLLKAIVDARTDKILGCTLYCIDSNEIINTVQMAMHAQMDYRVLRDTIFTHPSVSEVLNDLFGQIQ
ncbi:pyridine nucleotide-disulfide oxidoreductase [Ktedonobacter sp. SOSP1-85]|uniref:FAD-dependent oxidoreductase n=1 Tax=Ktedonobacter sp. SOSP1-85 TaxID=2778367 RepID=UPI00191609E9|nr:FAD-dependent oxidoreductase [Ktedonobacter sp. SOSP1-85]GHO80473.1 pyridine nucleotide-disulfide oxidoreductase [Ktedonobacter sp. SOSP1-85]